MYYDDPIKLFTLLVMELGCIDLTTWPAPPMRSGPRVHQIVDIHYRPCKLGFSRLAKLMTRMRALAQFLSRDPFPVLSIMRR